MTLSQIIETYLEGWKLGDGFHYDDPNTGRIQRRDFVAFAEDLKQAAIEMGAAENARPFLQYSDVVIKYEPLPATVWCWWQAVGTELQGSARILAGEAGVLHEKIAYFSRLPD